MANTTGTVNNFVELKTAIETFLTANGWTLTSGVLSKNGTYFKLVAVSTSRIELRGATGQSGSTLTGECSKYVKIFNPTYSGTIQFTWPSTYWIFAHTNPDEVYIVLKTAEDCYYQLSFGKSQLAIGGNGAWFSGSSSGTITETNAAGSDCKGYSTNTSFGFGFSYYHSYVGNLPFCNHYLSDDTYITTFFNSSYGWHINAGMNKYEMWCQSQIASLVSSQPNPINGNAVLLPIKIILGEGSYRLGIYGELSNFRILRNDNILPETELTYGSNTWKVFPAFRRDAGVRNLYTGSAVNQNSGTVAFAVRV